MKNEQHYSLNQILDAVGFLKQEKGVDKLLNLVKEKVFGNDINDHNVEEFKAFVRKFTSLYYLMKDKFAEKERSTGERYFEHLRMVVNNVLELPNPNVTKVLIAISHDSIEDTNKTYEGLTEDYGCEVALAVEAISKKSYKNYMNLEIEDLDERIKKAKQARNEDYFGHLLNFASFKNHIASLANSRGIELSNDKIEEISRNALDVKFADRIHNLSTQWDPDNIKQVKKKVEETKKYFLNIAQEMNIEAYTKLKSLVLTLEIRLNSASKQVEKVLGRTGLNH